MLSHSYSVLCFPLWLGFTVFSGHCLPLSLIGESLIRLGPLHRSNVPGGHIDRCEGTPTQASSLPSPLVSSYPVKYPKLRECSCPRLRGFRACQQGRSWCCQRVVSAPLKANQHHRRPPQLTSQSSPPLHSPVLAHVSQVAEQGISDPPHLSPAG